MTNQRNGHDAYGEEIVNGEMPIDINGWRGRATLEGAWRRLAVRLIAGTMKSTYDKSEAA